MNQPLTSSHGWSKQAEEILAATRNNAAERVLRLAKLLATMGPVPLAACLLPGDAGSAVAVVDHNGVPQPPWQAALAELLARWAAQSPVGEATEQRAPQLPGLGERDLWVALIFSGRRALGALATAAGDGASPRELLAARAEVLGLLLRLDRLQQGQEQLREEFGRQDRLSKIGEVAGLVAHEFNNALNGIVLHLAVIGLEAPEKVRAELKVIRDLANGAAAQVRKLQDYSRHQRPALVPVDLNAILRETVAWFTGLTDDDEQADMLGKLHFPDGVPASLTTGSVRVRAEPAPQLPPVQATSNDLRRLLRLLVASGAAAATAPTTITFGTSVENNRILLRVEAPGPVVPSETLAKLLDPFTGLQPGEQRPDLIVCKAIVRRLQGSIHVEGGPQGGLSMLVELQASPAGEGHEPRL
jgi:signal transduction histidine kinase